MRIMVGLPWVGKQGHAEIFRQAWTMADTKPEDWEVSITPSHCPSIERNRQQLLKIAIHNEVDWLYMQDSDLWVTNPESVWKMIQHAEEAGCEAIGAMYICKGGRWSTPHAEEEEEPFETDYIGTGASAWHVPSASEMKEPLFAERWNSPFEVSGCDYAACDRLRLLDMTVFCDPRVKVAHRTGVQYYVNGRGHAIEGC